MDMFIFIIGFLAIVVGLVLLVFNLIKKRPVKRYGITMLVGLVLIITGLFMPMKDDDTLTKDTEEKLDETERMVDEKEDKEKIEYEKEVDEKEDEIKVGLEDNELFNKVYYEIANRDQPHGKDAIINYLEANDFIFEEDKNLNSLKVKDNREENEDYVYMRFEGMEDDPSLELLASVSYYFKKQDIEVIFSNYSPNKELRYDNYATHKIGEANEKVDSLEEQITFLEENLN